MNIKFSIKLVLVTLFISSVCFAQELADGYEKGMQSITGNEINDHVSFFADDSMKGRPAGSDENLLASLYIARRFKDIGLQPLSKKLNPRKRVKDELPENLSIEDIHFYDEYLQRFSIQKAKLTSNNSFSITRKFAGGSVTSSYDYRDDFYVNYSETADISLTAPLVFAGYGIVTDDYNDYLDENGNDVDVKDKIVVIVDSYPRADIEESMFNIVKKRKYRFTKYKVAAARDKGALGVLVVQPPDASLPINIKYERIVNGFEKGKARLHERPRKNIPVIYLSNKAKRELFRNVGRKKVRKILGHIDSTLTPRAFALDNMLASFSIDLHCEVLKTQNVVGFLEGTDPELKDETIVIGAHYDHIGLGYYGTMDKGNIGQIHNGADDNASGTAGMMELAEAFSLSKPKRSIVFIAFDAEENGLLGSKHYAYYHPLRPLDKTIAMINLDMISRNSPEFLWVGGAFQGKDIIETVKEANKSIGIELFFNVGLFSYASDQAFFLRNEIPSLFFFAGDHEDYHTPGDDIEKMDFQKAERVTKLAFLTGWLLANQSGKPEYEDLTMDEKTAIVKESKARMNKYKDR